MRIERFLKTRNTALVEVRAFTLMCHGIQLIALLLRHVQHEVVTPEVR